MKVLNLYAGIGGNRKLWENVDVTAVEIDEEIAGIYKSQFPHDKVIVTDAHQYLLEHYKEFDFIWSSPPCPTHSRVCYSKNKKQYVNMTLYQQIIFLNKWFKGKFVIENVIPYYKPLIEPTIKIERHLFWSNFKIDEPIGLGSIDISRSTAKELSSFLKMPIPRIKARLLLRNCVNPIAGLYILNEAREQ